ncbi:hypothetical protein DRN69_00375 [Candidatus Pacearchaeota archaeon]|nr:MAG: hypothetical protein DRN69_00375 [Candidatus Pacearchaeota archaeon]
MRQYEKCDCTAIIKKGMPLLRNAYLPKNFYLGMPEYLIDPDKGQNLEITEIPINANLGGQVDPVLVFRNPDTEQIVWVPYNSKVQIGDGEYTVLRGELAEFKGARGFTKDQDIKCIRDQNGKVYDMDEFLGEGARVTRLYDSWIGEILQYLFDKKHHKLEPVNIGSFEQLKRYGMFKLWKTARREIEEEHKRNKKLWEI